MRNIILIQKRNTLDKEDFDGNDIANKYWDKAIKHIKKMDLTFAQNDIISTVMFELKLMSMRPQTEDYNQCGIFLLMVCHDYFSPISKKDASTSAQDRFKKKLRYLSTIISCYVTKKNMMYD